MEERQDKIFIRGMDLPVSIGVPEAERATLQVLQADISLSLGVPFAEMRDQIADTIDYEALTQRLRALAAARPRQLIETLAAELAEVVLTEFGAAWVSVELRKRILPGVDYVAVMTTRSRISQ